MLGYRRANLDLANKLYSSPVKVEFIQVNEKCIGQLMYALKRLKYEVEIYYENDQRLLEETKVFIEVCSKVVSTLSNYNVYFNENNELIVNYFKLTQKKIYIDLYRENVEPIINLIKILRKQQDNAYIETLLTLINEKQISLKNSYILTKRKFLDKHIEIGSVKYKVMQDKEFVNLGVFAETVIFLGTPSYFDSKFSRIFYGKKTIFLGYSCFENRLLKRRAFSDLISHNHLINTVYNDITLDKGFSGLNSQEAFTMKKEKKSEESLIDKFENFVNRPFEENVEVKIATISQNNYIFLPIKQKINVIDRDSLKIYQEKVKDLSVGDLLIFRDQNASSLVREEADKIMGSNAGKYRGNLEEWKERLYSNVKRKGIEKVSRILKVRYGISIAKENNIRNWMSNHSIKPSCLEELLTAFKFDQYKKTEILNAAAEIRSAHISAGHHISRTLMKELDENLENMINENGSYSFESKEFEGAFFNIEEIKRISNETYSIPENETLKIIKG
ncbi:DISARM anti-phage system protein DrmE domain-containing protein [Bacillus toyonensis]|uniref:DISARM anti-phage system protein DrmE domain-containing protein n=1 Tax=Bacillus toyonensis TaxID=155322 RepID=UPI0035D534A8